VKILGIDTSTGFLSLGIYDGSPRAGVSGAGTYECTLELGRQMSSLLIVTIQRALGALGWQARDLDYLACGLGPGSFTGVRLGVSAIKGMSWALHKPVIGISTLDIIAKNAINTRPVVVALDAKRSLIYCAAFKNTKGNLRRITPYLLLSEKEFFSRFKKAVVILGDALPLYKEKILKEIKGVTILDRDYWYPKAHNIIALTLERIKEKKFSNAFNIKPIYLYPKECQIKQSQKIKC